jgi:hypothetical protein
MLLSEEILQVRELVEFISWAKRVGIFGNAGNVFPRLTRQKGLKPFITKFGRFGKDLVKN